MLFCPPPPKIRKKSYMSERQWEAKLLICFAQTNGGSIATTPFCKWSLLLSKRGGHLLTSHLYRHYPCVYIITCSFLMLSLRKQSVPSGKTITAYSDFCVAPSLNGTSHEVLYAWFFGS